MQRGTCNKWPLLLLTKLANNTPARYIANGLIRTGYRNCSGLERMMVTAYEQSSKAFWMDASTEENEPLCSASTSCSDVRRYAKSYGLGRRKRTSWMITWAQRSNPQRPTLLAMTPPTSPNAEKNGDFICMKRSPAMVTHSACQLMNHNPALIGPILRIANGASQVADSSNATETMRARAICVALKPTDRRKVIIWPPNESTVKYSNARDIEGRNTGWLK